MEHIIIIGHGSPKKEANNIDAVCRLLHARLHPGCAGQCVRDAYLQFSEPDIPAAIRRSVYEGADKIVIHPFFLSAGMHATRDIPELINEARSKYPGVRFVYTEPLGIHEKLISLVQERIMSAEGMMPAEIEQRSFEIIGEETDLDGLPAEQIPIIKRVIHATADFEFRQTLVFHPGAIAAGLKAIRAGKDILTDVEMVRSGINKKALAAFGGKVICRLQEGEDKGKESGRTRAEQGIELALTEKNNVGIIAVGNAPTALLRVIELFESGHGIQNSESGILVVGVPVGFVKALESKALLASRSFPFITNMSRKGGSPVAAAIINALIQMAGEQK
jgi:precorrin-8X/cobalt-precorrin-8 methylmutase